MAGWQISEAFDLRAKAAQLILPGQMFVGGAWSDAADGRTLEVIDPYTESVIGTVPAGSPADAATAVRAAREAFDHGPWPRMSGRERARYLFQVAQLIREHQEQFGLIESIDNGKPIRESQWAAPAAAEVFEYYAGWADKYHGEVVPLKSGHLNLVTREPVGVVAAITPWNFPTTQATFKTVPAIAMGNTVVHKPAEWAPLTALLLARLCAEAGIPDGVWNVLTGIGEEAGAALCEQDGVDAIAFTGSTETGQLVMQAAGRGLKPVSLECGGKSPHILFADADLDAAIPAACSGIFYNQGEVCNAGSRLLVQDAVYEQVLDRLIQSARALRLGDPLEPETQMGCLVSTEHLARNLQYIDLGLAEGAELVTGGRRWGERGFFLEPTIFTGVNNRMRIAQEEIFGPVLTVLRFSTLEHAVELANDSVYGLAAGVWTQDISTAHRVSAQLKVGTVWVNVFGPFDIASPWTGWGHSGVGTEWGRNILDFVTIPKSVWIAR